MMVAASCWVDVFNRQGLGNWSGIERMMDGAK
jgi:hypothetical protein